jgi:2,3-bisphosphoglycerate-dependent phosphoglycerate mutase
MVRHGENRANLTKEFSHRRVDYPLTAKGVLQAQQTADYFRTRDISAIYASPLKRAAQTASIIAAALGLEPVIFEEFREINVGSLEGQQPTADLWAFHDRIIESWRAGAAETHFPDGEDYITLWNRIRQGIEQILGQHPDGNVVLVAHAGIFTHTLGDLCPGTTVDWPSGPANHNCSITELMVQMQNRRPFGQLVTWASADHLHGLAANLVPGIPQPGELPDGPACLGKGAALQ